MADEYDDADVPPGLRRPSRAMRRLYNILLLPVRGAVVAWGTLQLASARREEWSERLARRLPRAIDGGVWIHGASVGEARITGEIARALRRSRPGLSLAVSAYTATGRGELPRPPEVDCAFFAPLDFPGFPARVLRALRPALLVLVETEIWPNLLHEADRTGVRVALINGRLSAHRMATYRRLSGIYRPLLSSLCAVGAQSESDASRFRELGVEADALRITGNVKYDIPTPPVDAALLRRTFGLPGAPPVFVAGSTAQGEDRAVLEAFALARSERQDLLLVLAPRHPERCAAVEGLARAAGFRVRKLSDSHPAAGYDVLLVDSIGPLRQLYGVAAAAFVGGSLVPVGGHNVMEPVAAGVPVLYGPHTDSVAETASELERRGGALRVRDARELGRAVCGLLAEPARAGLLVERGRGVLAANRGALGRSVELLLSQLDRPSAARAHAP